jgi:hypothetical protein
MCQFDFRCEAYDNCRAGSLDWKGFENITVNGRESALRKFHESDLKHWYRLLRRTSGLLNLDLHERVALTMFDYVRTSALQIHAARCWQSHFAHRDLADLVGASRPRVTEQLAQLEREHLVIRQGRQFIARVDKIRNAIVSAPLQDQASEESSPFHKSMGCITATPILLCEAGTPPPKESLVGVFDLEPGSAIEGSTRGAFQFLASIRH